MKARTSLIIWGVLFTSQLYAQQKDKIKVPRVNSSAYIITKDTNRISYPTAEKVAFNFGLTKYRENFSTTLFKTKTGLSGGYITAFGSVPIKPAIESYIKLRDTNVHLNSNEQVYLYGFTSILGEGSKSNRNFSKMMMSAYKQEMDLNYAQNPENFSFLIEKDKSEYWKRNWINMGYGMSYIAKDNPFMGKKGLAVGFLYIIEALHYYPIFGGAFFGESQSDKITIPLIGLASLLAWKGIMGSFGNKQLKLNKSITKSGYRIPNNFEY